jgi:chemotaxis protein histidine kinase CheA
VSRVYAEAQTTAALRALIARVTEPALAELEALRVALDVRCEALTAALVGTECIDPASLRELTDRLAHEAREEADAAARAARSQALEEGQVRQELERAEAEKQLALTRALAAAEREANRLEHAALTETLEQARTQVDAIRAHAEAQLEEAHAETERAVAAAQLGASEAMRAQLEEARAEAQRAHAETDRVEQAAQARFETARAEFETQKELEAASRAVLLEALEEARTEVDAARTSAQMQIKAAQAAQAEALARVREVAQAETRAAHATQQPAGPPGGANPPDEIPDQLSTTLRTLDEAANVTHVLDALLDGLGAVFPRAALFVVKSQSQRLQGWRSVGFTGVAAITKEVEFSLATDSALTRAVTTGRVIITGDGRAPDREPAAGAGGPWTVTLPVAIGDRVVAVVHGDGGGRIGNSAPSFDRGTALKVSDMLVRHAGRRFAALTTSARTAFGDLIREAPTTPEPIAEPAEQARQEEPGRHEDARRYACLLVSEIKQYNEANPLAGLPDRSLPERLKGEIERCRNVYARRLPPEVDATFNFFDEALCEILGAGDVDVRGQLDKTTGAPPNNAALDRPATAAQPLSLRT